MCLGVEFFGSCYLYCLLCVMEWYYVCIKCMYCQNIKGIYFQNLQVVGDQQFGQVQMVQVECCDECGYYFKIVYMEKDLQVELVVDDFVLLILDLFVVEIGLQCSGVNLMLLFGDFEFGVLLFDLGVC